MHGTVAEARALAGAVAAAVAAAPVEVVLAPPYTALAAVAQELAGSPVGLAAQNMHWAEAGAFTGEVSPGMVRELAGYVLLGHSERRLHFAETDTDVNRKLQAAFQHDLVPIVCIGETAHQRDAGQTDDVVHMQLACSLEALPAEQAERLVLAYEPVWAIGSGRACDADEAQRVAALVRAWCAVAWSGRVAERLRLLYGGSLAPANAAGLFAMEDIDGGLVGGASLDAAGFAAIVAAAGGGRG
jgi:triosephosphate isomerase